MAKANCPMDGKASVSTTTIKYYYGNCENTFKERFNNHYCSFRNLVKRTLNCPSTYENWKRKILIILLIRILLWNRRNMFVDLESVIYSFVRSSLFQEQILSCYINVMSLSQNAHIEINLLWSVLKIDKIIYTIQCI